MINDTRFTCEYIMFWLICVSFCCVTQLEEFKHVLNHLLSLDGAQNQLYTNLKEYFT